MDWKEAEDRARRYLRAKGYRILEKNYRTSFGEVDLIVKKGKTYVFVEVKSGHSGKVRPSERVDRDKYERIARVAEFYLRGKRYEKARIDVIEICGDTLVHYENVGWEFA